MDNSRSPKPIYKEIHFLRAAACVLVVIVHVTAAAYTIDEGFKHYILGLLNQYSRIGTPVFAVLSAFLLFHSANRGAFQLGRFVRSRMTKIFFPFLFWTLFYMLLSTVSGFRVSLDPISIISIILLGGGYYHLYFVSVVLQFYCLFPIIRTIKNPINLFILFIVSLPVNLFALSESYHDMVVRLNTFDTILAHRALIIKWISFFLLGALLARHFEWIRRALLNRAFAVTLVLLMGGVIAGIFIEIQYAENYLSSSRPLNLLYVPIFIPFMLLLYRYCSAMPIVVKLFSLIGSCSFGIYLIHPFIIFLMTKLLPPSFWNPYSIIPLLAATIALCISLIKVVSLLPMSRYVIPVTAAKSNDALLLTKSSQKANV